MCCCEARSVRVHHAERNFRPTPEMKEIEFNLSRKSFPAWLSWVPESPLEIRLRRLHTKSTREKETQRATCINNDSRTIDLCCRSLARERKHAQRGHHTRSALRCQSDLQRLSHHRPCCRSLARKRKPEERPSHDICTAMPIRSFCRTRRKVESRYGVTAR